MKKMENKKGKSVEKRERKRSSSDADLEEYVEGKNKEIEELQEVSHIQA